MASTTASCELEQIESLKEISKHKQVASVGLGLTSPSSHGFSKNVPISLSSQTLDNNDELEENDENSLQIEQCLKKLQYMLHQVQEKETQLLKQINQKKRTASSSGSQPREPVNIPKPSQKPDMFTRIDSAKSHKLRNGITESKSATNIKVLSRVLSPYSNGKPNKETVEQHGTFALDQNTTLDDTSYPQLDQQHFVIDASTILKDNSISSQYNAKNENLTARVISQKPLNLDQSLNLRMKKENIAVEVQQQPEAKKKSKCVSCIKLLSFGLSTRNCDLCATKKSNIKVCKIQKTKQDLEATAFAQAYLSVYGRWRHKS